MGRPLLVADGGTMTVGRRQATYVYGSFEVRLPEGKEQADVEKRLQNGYIYRPDEPARGRFDVAFVRADATVDLPAQTSDLETQIEAAQRRTEGDIFFERDITDSGTGRYRPGIDLKRGDIVDVLIWGRILPLPITRWEMISDGTASIGWRWHVGGVMIEDAEALRNHNDQLLQQIAQEKRQMAKTVTDVSDRADSAARAANEASNAAGDAQSTANSAQETAEDALEKWRQQKDELDALQTRQIKELDAQNEALRRLGVLQEPLAGSISDYDALILGPVKITYPARNKIDFELLSGQKFVSGASVLVNARVNAISQYTHSFPIRLTASRPKASGAVGWAENYAEASILVIPTADFSAILAEERAKRDLT
ncbi:Hypothetical protein Cul210931_1848 [Corynebacterium ulcerans]|uniref:hypothetical protein n=1 Tax=Corynebacterium ulcerans TaxID=65058 RepID=UPI0005210D48|nr:hypothetical protein [Corynebacterium ulcerans]AIU31163.1 Hypothetical protein Cul210931_1848 [Corynebacterium ulcerans]NOL63126.1 hypothetical protein [Corynebacterium ulcerans]